MNLNNIEYVFNVDTLIEKYCLVHQSYNVSHFEFLEWCNMYAIERNRFYANFLSDHQPLGDEFEKVLWNNIWDLYEN